MSGIYNWCKEHLIWTYFLQLFIAWGILFTVVLPTFKPQVFEAGMAIYMIFFSITFIIVNAWIIWQKGRSLWWLLLIGWFSPLWLTNNNVIKPKKKVNRPWLDDDENL